MLVNCSWLLSFCCCVVLQLGLNKPAHELSMVAVCEEAQTTSVLSNVVELLTEPFLPFAFFSFLTQDPKYV